MKKHKGKKRKMSNNKKNFFAATCIFLALIAVLCFWMIKENNELNSKTIDGMGAMEIKKSLEMVYINGEPYIPKPEVMTVLFFGVDKFGSFTDSNSYNNDEQCDFLTLIVIDKQEHSYKVIHLNRDTMTDVEMIGLRNESAGTKTMQLALAHTYGSGLKDSCKNTVNAVSNLLYGTHIDGYVAVSMDAIPIITDYIDGVTVTIDEDLTSLDETYTEGATVTLSGEKALEYVRARTSVSDGTNIARMARQKKFMNSVIERMKEKNTGSDFSATLCRKLSEYMLSDMNVNTISDLSDVLDDYTFNGIISPEGFAEVNKGYMEFHADDEELKKMVTEIFYQKTDEYDS